jgi:hypothetical protein
MFLHALHVQPYVQFLMQTTNPDNLGCKSALYYATNKYDVSLDNVT